MSKCQLVENEFTYLQEVVQNSRLWTKKDLCSIFLLRAGSVKIDVQRTVYPVVPPMFTHIKVDAMMWQATLASALNEVLSCKELGLLFLICVKVAPPCLFVHILQWAKRWCDQV